MPTVRATAVLNKLSGIPRDASRNVWHFDVAAVDSATLQQIATGLGAFYGGMQSFLAKSVASATNAHRVDLAELTYGGDGAFDDVVSPVLATYPFSTPSVDAGGTPLPGEVAVCLSFRADITGIPEKQGTSRPRSRRRGRVYLGPLSASAISALSPAFEPQVAVAAREAILDGYDLALASWATTPAQNIDHVVYSRTDSMTLNVEHISVDNEFDTIRRRGRKPALRMSRAVAQGTAPGTRSGTDVALAS